MIDDGRIESPAHLLRQAHCTADDQTLRSAVSMLTLGFFPERDRAAYLPLARLVDGALVPSSELARALSDGTFRAHLVDAIDTGLYLSRHRHGWAQGLVVGERYSRKDACRLLNWVSNQQSTIYGYKVDHATATCPTFVTYHKHKDVAATVAYADEFRPGDDAVVHSQQADPGQR